MPIRTYLENLINAKEARASELRELIKNAQTADECRSLGETLTAVLKELDDAKAQLDALDDDDQSAENRNVNPMHQFRQIRQYDQQTDRDADPTNSKEYRTAFMNFACRGTPVPTELRAGNTTTTTDASAMIPTTILREIIKEAREYGEIYARVRHLNIQGGVQIPVLSLKPKATWITANTGTAESEKQKAEAKTFIEFKYFGLECKISRTLLTNITVLEEFQEEFIKLASEAIVQAIEVAIFNGTGNGEPLGITKDTRIPAKNVITMDEGEVGAWDAWHKKVFATMGKAYRNGVFIMAQGTFEGYVNGMVDSNGQPIGRVNYGITDGEMYRFGGKEVLTVEDDVLPNYDTASTGDVVAVFVKLDNYGINSNMQMRAVEWTDQDTNEIKNKCILIADGKLIDANGVLLIKKG